MKADYRHLAATLSKLSSVPSRAAVDASEGIADLIGAQFDDGVDPYGREWEALAQSTQDRGRTPPPLTDTGVMRSKVIVRPRPGAGIEIAIESHDRNYARFHQTGTKNMPRRAILPDRGALPPSWQAAIGDAVDKHFAKAMGR